MQMQKQMRRISTVYLGVREREKVKIYLYVYLNYILPDKV